MEAVGSQHPIFKRQDTSIYSTVPISFARAALGGPIRIKTVDGEVEYDVRPGTQTDTKVRLKGKGVPSLRSRSVRGDPLCYFGGSGVPEYDEPKAQKDALRRFDDAMNGVASPEEEEAQEEGHIQMRTESISPDRRHREPVRAFLRPFPVWCNGIVQMGKKNMDRE